MDKSIRVLHVDDASAFAEVTPTALERESERLNVETAANASEGLDRLSAEAFDCVVSDYEMPDESGIAFLRTVRETYPDLPFILFTGKGSEEIASDAISAGATDYLLKSSADQYTLLANRIENAVEQYRESQRRRDLERVGVWRDVTAKRERERALEQYREYTERMFDSIDDIFFALDEQANLLRWNDALVEACGYSEAEIESMHALDFLPEDYRDLATAVLEKGFETGHVRLEAPLLTSDGEEIPYEYTADRVAHPDGEPRLVGVGRDISERVQREEELRRHNERLSEFANIVSHDLRNPLNVADGRIELARDECDSEHLNAAKSAIERSHALIEELLSLARAGNQAGDPEPVDIERAVSECWRNVPTAEATIRTNCSRTVRADRSRLEQLLENLIRNAVEHGGEDVTITIGNLDDGFYVADDGPGIPPDLHEDVFKPGQSTAKDGTGYGLAIVEQVADAHGWAVHLTESESSGARFEFTGVDNE